MAIKLAEEVATDDVEGANWRSAMQGNVRAQEFWLRNRRPEKWGDTKQVHMELSGPDGDPVKIQQINEIVDNMTPEQLSALDTALSPLTGRPTTDAFKKGSYEDEVEEDEEDEED
jgi:hypothetical protein